MQIKAKICFEYQQAEEAVIASESLRVDNLEFINSYVYENKLICNSNSDSLKTFLATTDDLLFCEMMVEKVLELNNNSKKEFR